MNQAATVEAVDMALISECQELDSHTSKLKKTIRLPESSPNQAQWDFIGLLNDRPRDKRHFSGLRVPPGEG